MRNYEVSTKDNKMYTYIYNYFNPKYPFQFFIGSRGDGKTYGALGGAIEEPRIEKFMYSRLTDKEYQIVLDKKGVESGNPFKKYNANNGTNYGITSINKALGGIYNRETDDAGKYICVGAPIGYATALYNISDIRGLDFSDLTDWILDEFVPEKHKHGMQDMADALFNAYETLNRNRELEGQPPLYFWGISNSNNIYNDMFKGLGIVADVEKMKRKKQYDKYYPDRGLAIHLIKNSKIFEEEKAQTALYKLARGTKFADMALNNNFAYDDFSLVGFERLDDKQPLVACSKNGVEIFIYKKKGAANMYCSYGANKQVERYNLDKEHEKRLFKSTYGSRLYTLFIQGLVTFESYEIKAILLEFLLKR